VNQAVGATKVESDQWDTGSANGGAIFHAEGSILMTDTLLSGNLANGGSGTERGAAMTTSGPGNGGAIFNQAGMVQLSNSALIGNQANGGPALSAAPWGTVGGTGAGGAIYNQAGLMAVNCTIAGNTANGGAGLISINIAFGGPAYGGAIASVGGNTALLYTTIADNAVQAGQIGSADALGSSLWVPSPLLTLSNSILACSPQQTNVFGRVNDGGHNICSDGSAGFTSPTSRNAIDPMLGPLGDNGGSSPTKPLVPGSPAIDEGDNATCPVTDQRGVARPYGPACDIGAFEWVPVVP